MPQLDTGDGAGLFPVDHYLSPAATWEASEVLSALADRLARTEGVWADDARADAQRVRVLAESLRAWCPRLSDDSRRALLRRVDGDRSYWDHLLALYLG